MTHIENTESHPKRSTGTRVFLLVASAVTSLIAIGLVAFGGLALWGDSQKDERGYLSTDSHRFAASTHAIATENLDMDLDGVEELVDSTGLGDIRIDVAPQSGKPVFAGIARTDELSAYLRDVAHTTVTDLDFEPFEASYKAQGGQGTPAAPAAERIWAASSQGAGPQTLTWDVEDGEWSIVVMNADGTSGVQADISAGAKVPYLNEIGWSALGGGAILLIAAAALLGFGLRPPRQRPQTAHAGGLAPTAG